MSTPVTCYHHNDMDGRSAGYLVAKRLAKRDYINFKECDYNTAFDKDNTGIVYFVDMSFGEDTYDKLKAVIKTAKKVIWIDHHKTSVDLINSHKEEFRKYRNLVCMVSSAFCGAALTWLYFHIPEIETILRSCTGLIPLSQPGFGMAKYDNTTYYFPKWLAFVDDFDCWKKKNSNTDHFLLGADKENTNVFVKVRSSTEPYDLNPFWDQFEKNHMQYIFDGRSIKKYLDMKYQEDISNGYETRLPGGAIAYVINSRGNSWVFQNKIEQYPAVILYHFDSTNNRFNYSVYSSDKVNGRLDCSKFAEKYGGGGHIGASGFSTAKMEFQPFNKIEHKVFLGGTCADTKWREALIPKLDEKGIKFFNPVVEDWTPECMKNEEKEKEICDIHLYVIIADKTQAPYSIAEAVESSNTIGVKTIFCVMNDRADFYNKKVNETISEEMQAWSENDNPLNMNEGVLKSYSAIIDLLRRNRTCVVEDFDMIDSVIAEIIEK